MKKHIVSLGWNASFAFNTIKDATRFIEALSAAERLSSRWCGKEYYVTVDSEKMEFLQGEPVTEEQYQKIVAEHEAKQAAENAAKEEAERPQEEPAEDC
jgi:hypothetical protein